VRGVRGRRGVVVVVVTGSRRSGEVGGVRVLLLMSVVGLGWLLLLVWVGGGGCEVVEKEYEAVVRIGMRWRVRECRLLFPRGEFTIGRNVV
jgi:hypothetical protein